MGWNPLLEAAERRAGLDITEIGLCLGKGLFGTDVTGYHDDGVARAIVRLEPFLDVGETGGIEVVHRADRFPGVGVIGRKELLQDFLEDLAVGLVIALALFVLHHTTLFVELGLGDGVLEMAHPVRLEPEGGVQGVLRHGLKIVGAVEEGGAIEIGGTQLLQGVQVFALEILRALEHQVLEEVGEAGAAADFVLGAHVVPDVDSHDRCLVILVDDDREAVVEHALRVGNINGGLGGDGSCDEESEGEK